MAKKKAAGFSADEKAAMKERAREAKGGGEGEAEVLAKIAKMKEPDRALAKRVHELVMAAAPELAPRTWYGMPAYAKNGTVLCFFQDAAKFKARYATLGFNSPAMLDDGNMWATSFAVKKLTKTEEAKITELVRRAAQ